MIPTQEEIPLHIPSTRPCFALVGESLVYPIVAMDPNGDTITFQPVIVHASMVVIATDLVTWTPGEAGKVDISTSESQPR